MTIEKMMSNIGALSCVKRYSDHHLVKDESVLEHVGFVGILAAFIGEKLSEEGFDIDYGYLLQKAVVHDFDEVETGDISMPVKYYSAELRELIGDMEKAAVFRIDQELFNSSFLYTRWLNAKDGKTGSIVSLCDLLAVIYKIHDEAVMRGNKTVVGIVGHLPPRIKERCNKICNEYQRESEFLKRLETDAIKMISTIESQGV